LIHRIIVGQFQTNCYICACRSTREAVVIDPGGESDRIKMVLNRESYELRHILNTHGHPDHVAGASALRRETGSPILIHKADAPMLLHPDPALSAALDLDLSPAEVDGYLVEGMEIRVGKIGLTVRETPGHSPGSVCFVGDSACFCGDTVFAGSVGRTDLPGGSYPELVESLRRVILNLPPETHLLPGHGPETTVGIEMRRNPFVLEAMEKP